MELLDDVTRSRLGVSLLGICYSCAEEETFEHVFLSGKIAQEIWSYCHQKFYIVLIKF